MTIDVAAPAARPPYRPTPTISASIALHVAAGAGAAIHPELWPSAAGAVAANHLFLGAVGLWPRSSLLGPNIRRLPPESAARGEIAITFDDGPDPEVTPRVLDLLDEAGARASFFCVADHAARHAGVCAEIVRRGHAVENHSLRHSHTFAFLGMGGFRREISAAQAALLQACGRAPRYFRAPAGLRNPLLEPVLHELGLTLVSWTRRGFDTRGTDPAAVAARLTRGLAAGDILLLHDGGPARTASGAPVVLESLRAVLARARSLDLRPVALHQAIGLPARAREA